VCRLVCVQVSVPTISQLCTQPWAQWLAIHDLDVLKLGIVYLCMNLTVMFVCQFFFTGLFLVRCHLTARHRLRARDNTAVGPDNTSADTLLFSEVAENSVFGHTLLFGSMEYTIKVADDDQGEGPPTHETCVQEPSASCARAECACSKVSY
jgi:hypothetical protein